MTHEHDGYGLQPMRHFDERQFARGEAPVGPPAGTVFVAAMNSYVDADVAESLGLSRPAASPIVTPEAESVPEELMFPQAHREEPIGMWEGDDPSDEELAELQDQIEDLSDREPSLSPTLDDIAAYFGSDFESAIDTMVVGTNDDALDALTAATGLDRQTATNLIEAAVLEAAPHGVQEIGQDCWNSIVYAASATPDPHARRIVSDLVTGKLHPSKLARAYDLWWQSLPDAEG